MKIKEIANIDKTGPHIRKPLSQKLAIISKHLSLHFFICVFSFHIKHDDIKYKWTPSPEINQFPKLHLKMNPFISSKNINKIISSKKNE